MVEKDDKKHKSTLSLTLKILAVFNLGPVISLMLFTLDRKTTSLDIPIWVCLTPALVHIVALLALGMLGDRLKKE